MRKIPKPRVLLGSLVAVAALVALAVVPVMAQVPVFSPFSGDVTVDGADAPVGTVIDVYVGTEATARATTTVTVPGEYAVVLEGTDADVGLAVTFMFGTLTATATPANPLFARYAPQTVDLAFVAVVGPQPDISVSPALIAFGDVAVGRSSTSTVTISNAGDAALTITGITITGTNADQFSVGTYPGTIAAGGSANVNVTFSPTSINAKSATLNIASNDPDEATVTVALSGTGVERVEAETFADWLYNMFIK